MQVLACVDSSSAHRRNNGVKVLSLARLQHSLLTQERLQHSLLTQEPPEST